MLVAASIRARILGGNSRMIGTMTQRSSGIKYCGRYLPAAIGSSSACTYTGTPWNRASAPAAPEWSG
jgi:hypothetical protein